MFINSAVYLSNIYSLSKQHIVEIHSYLLYMVDTHRKVNQGISEFSVHQDEFGNKVLLLLLTWGLFSPFFLLLF